MIKYKLSLAILSIFVAGALTISSCKKKEKEPEPTETPDTDQSGTDDNNIAEGIDGDITEMGSESSDKGNNGDLNGFRSLGTEQSLLSCATVSVDTGAKKVTVTFNGGVCIDNKTRSGSLVFDYSASTNGAKRYRHPGFSMTITSNNYVVNGHTVTINNKTVTNTTPANFNPLTTNQTWSITANIMITKSGGGTISWNCNRVKTLLNTSAVYLSANLPILWGSARVGLTGSAGGTRSNGETFSVNITNQLIRDFGLCTGLNRHAIIQGTLVYTPQNKPVRTVDYGNGTCDRAGTVQINGLSYPFSF